AVRRRGACNRRRLRGSARRRGVELRGGRSQRDSKEEGGRAASFEDRRRPRARASPGLDARAATGSRARPACGGVDPGTRDGRSRHAYRASGAHTTGIVSIGARDMRSVPFAPLEPALYREAVRRALAEDLGWGDVTTEATVDPSLRAKGIILAKTECVIAGLDIAAEAFSQLDP